MPLELRLDISGLEDVWRALQQIQPGINAALPIALNAQGPELFRDVVEFIADHFKIPEGEVVGALSSLQASEVVPTYAIAAHDSQLPYVRWITQRDEKVCKICGPRDGRIFSLDDVTDIWPAHPNCRCLLERVGLTEALLMAGNEVLPASMEAVSQDLLKQVEQLIQQFGGRGP